MTTEATRDQKVVLDHLRQKLRDYKELHDVQVRPHRPIQLSRSHESVYILTYNNTPVCVEVFKEDQVDFSHTYSDFILIKIWSPLTNKHVVQFYGWILNSGSGNMKPTPGLVSYWREGGKVLSDYLKPKQAMTDEQRLTMLLDIGSGLDFLHAQAIVHGGVKPASCVACAPRSSPLIF
ncbi:uncharacterized protein EI90DRAFT_1257304 [Cantharellus anzutake]|uniref:uncharacterized protein n=1 Tax=Cantharellus anzutake TaxID=1750568 RepID=UPI001903AE1D|nr:uncharacterized protein EI90DRAFT_1257304 [Cantharellus anzutake]KAF8330010.1 hypothetical protein EI90DRAFT_1257304 [Cantharellus anzutake]